MKHGVLFCLLGLLLAAMPRLYGGGWTFTLLWPALNLLILGIAYMQRDAAVFGKRSDGSLSPLRVVLFLPYLLFTWAVWHVCRLLPEPAAQQINNKLTVGRRLFGNERPPQITTILDLTSEFAEPAAERWASRACAAVENAASGGSAPSWTRTAAVWRTGSGSARFTIS